MRQSYTLGPSEIQEAIGDWLRDRKEFDVPDEVKITTSVSGKDGHGNNTLDISPVEVIEVVWGKPE